MRCRTIVPALLAAGLFCLASSNANAFELFDRVMNLGGDYGVAQKDGCDACQKGGAAQKGGCGNGACQKGGCGAAQKGGCDGKGGACQKGGCGAAQKGGRSLFGGASQW
ncbi:MAG: hypothetical protein HYV60_12345 [Planctomycetia bacterium]|nr:hypothetical protein [Planctomycetia bacterium]